MLNAVLSPDGLGKFRRRNGVHSAADDWDTKVLDRCSFSGKQVVVSAMSPLVHSR